MPDAADIDRVLTAVDDAADEIVGFTADLIRIPTINPPGEAYEECARFIGDRLQQCRLSTSNTTPRTACPNTRPVTRESTSSACGAAAAHGRPCTSMATSTSCLPARDGPSIRSPGWYATAASTGAARAT